MDSNMMYMTLQTTLLGEVAGAATIGRSGFFVCSNGGQALGMTSGATSNGGGVAVRSRQIQGVGVFTHAPMFADVDGIDLPRRRKRRS